MHSLETIKARNLAAAQSKAQRTPEEVARILCNAKTDKEWARITKTDKSYWILIATRFLKETQ